MLPTDSPADRTSSAMRGRSSGERLVGGLGGGVVTGTIVPADRSPTVVRSSLRSGRWCRQRGPSRHRTPPRGSRQPQRRWLVPPDGIGGASVTPAIAIEGLAEL